MSETDIVTDGSRKTVAIKGSLDSLTAPEFGKKVKGQLDGITTLILDLEDLTYISSAGLRELLELQQIMDEQGEMILENASEVIRDVMEVSGFSQFMTVHYKNA